MKFIQLSRPTGPVDRPLIFSVIIFFKNFLWIQQWVPMQRYFQMYNIRLAFPSLLLLILMSPLNFFSDFHYQKLCQKLYQKLYQKLPEIIVYNLQATIGKENRSLMKQATQKTSDQPMHNYSRHRFVDLSMQNKFQLHSISPTKLQKLHKSQYFSIHHYWSHHGQITVINDSRGIIRDNPV